MVRNHELREAYMIIILYWYDSYDETEIYGVFAQ